MVMGQLQVSAQPASVTNSQAFQGVGSSVEQAVEGTKPPGQGAVPCKDGIYHTELLDRISEHSDSVQEPSAG